MQDDKIYSQREVDELYKQWMRGSRFFLGTVGRKKREVWTVKGKVSQKFSKFYTCLEMFNFEVYSLQDVKV